MSNFRYLFPHTYIYNPIKLFFKMTNSYIDALKKKGTQTFVAKPSERRQAMIDQAGKCAKCGKDMKPMYTKFVRNPQTQKMEVICSNCAVSIAKR